MAMTKELKEKLAAAKKEYEELQREANAVKSQDAAETISGEIKAWMMADGDWADDMASRPKDELKLIGKALAEKIPKVIEEKQGELDELQAKREARLARRKERTKKSQNGGTVSNAGVTEDDYAAAQEAAGTYDEYGQETGDM